MPLFKLAALVAAGLAAAQRRSDWRRTERARLYRIIEVIGRWSMLDVFVVSLLAGLVRIQGFAEITAGVGIAAFGAVVVLTMLASLSFDPRLTWDGQAAMDEMRGRTRHAPTRKRDRTAWLTKSTATAGPAGRHEAPQLAALADLADSRSWRRWSASRWWRSILIERGPEITLTFKTAEGLEAGKTAVKYKDVEIGTVQSLRLADDRSHVRVLVQLTKEAKQLHRRGHALLGGAPARSTPPASRASARCSRAPTSARTPASRTRRPASSPGSRCRRS